MTDSKELSGTSPTLCSIPPEIRLKIYKHYFSSLVLDYAYKDDDYATADALTRATREELAPTGDSGMGISWPTTEKAQQPSILRACKLFYREASPFWMSLVTFRFSCTEVFVFFLSRLQREVLEQIRYITVKAFPFPVFPITDSGGYYTHSFEDTLCLFPGLQLDLLTVLECYHDPDVNDGWGDLATFCVAEGLLQSKGWKELRFFSPTDDYLAKSHFHREDIPQPATWRKQFLGRDGAGSGASLKIFRAKLSGVPGATLDADQRDDLDLLDGQSQGAHAEDSSTDKGKETMLVARRGKGAAYVQDGKGLSPPLANLLKKYQSWPKIKKAGHLVDGTLDPCAHL